MLLAVALYVFGGRGKPIESIAILPFVNASGSADSEYLSDGIPENLINSLSRLPNVRVVSRSAAFRYKSKDPEPRAVGRDLNVRAVLRGRLVQRGGSLSISVEFVDAGDNRHLWGEQYNRRLADLAALQEQLGREIAEQLRPRLSPEQKKALARRATRDPEAHQEYLKGLYFWNKRTDPGIQTAIEHIAEEIEDMGKSQRRELESRLAVLLVHLLKWGWQRDKRSSSWKVTVATQRAELRRLFRQSPSLKAPLPESIAESCGDAVEEASLETGLPADTFSGHCPFTPEQMLDRNFLPE